MSSPYTHSPWSSNTSLSSIPSQTHHKSPALSRSSTTKAKKRAPKTFHLFLRLPLELRRLILTHALTCPSAIDISTVLSPFHSLLLTSHHISAETISIFFQVNTFRLLPTHPAAAVSRAAPLLAYIQPNQLQLITSLELRLGPFWTNPPRCWTITQEFQEMLGLMPRVRELKVFAERDPSVEMYEGFRQSKTFYTDFSGRLLEDVLRALRDRHNIEKALKSVELDGVGAAVKKDGDLMLRLQNVVWNEGLGVVWGEGMEADEEEEEREFIGTRAGVVMHPPVRARMPTGWSLSSAQVVGSQGEFSNHGTSAGSAMEDIEFSMATLDLAAQSMSLQQVQLVYPHA